MNTTIQKKLQKLIPAIYYHLKASRPGSGIMDFGALGASVINYMISKGEIQSWEREECSAYLAHLISLAFPAGLPEYVVKEMKGHIEKQSRNGFDDISIMLYNKL